MLAVFFWSRCGGSCKKGRYIFMKKAGIIIILVLAIVGIFAFAPKGTASGEQYLRIHIRANSNGTEDQNVKYKVKDAVVKYLTPYLSECETFPEALDMIERRIKGIESAADKVLKENGFTYTSKAAVKREDFPTRSYDGFVLESGVYDALIVALGSGTGDNWWCVVYPPLCFINAAPNGSDEVKYKSKLLEIIEKFKK